MQRREIECIKKKIREILAESPVPEDPIHAENTLLWLERIHGRIDDALYIAALGHDIERAIPHRKVRREDFEDYDDFKRAHCENSASILAEIMEECNAPEELINRVVEIVRMHEFGGSREADALKNADALSFFDTNLPLYFAREGERETEKRILWGLKRLSPEYIHHVMEMEYNNRYLEELVKRCIKRLKEMDR